MLTLKEFLSQGLVLDTAINAKMEMLTELRRKSMVTKSFLNSCGGLTRHSRVEETVERLMKLEESIDEEIDRYVGIKEEIAALISRLPDITQRTLLEQHYIGGKKWAEIAEANYISLRNAMYLHKKALAILEQTYTERRTA